SREDLIKRFVSTEFNRFLEYYQNAPDLDVPENRDQRRPKSDRMRGSGSYARFFINVGRVDGMHPQGLMSLINKHTRNRAIEIGKTQIMNKVSFFEADNRFSDDIIRAFQKSTFENRRLVVEIAEESGSAGAGGPGRKREFRGGERRSFRPGGEAGSPRKNSTR
ncbi:MAG TPA: DbpA RNA binding domain-containing protein, partial [Spirochaetota bacterium]